MRRNCLAIVLLTIVVPSGVQAQNGVIHVGPNVQVSTKNSDRAHWEVRMAADPENAKRLLACSMVHSGQQNSIHTIVYASSDGGANWTPTLESDRTPIVADPECIFGLDGTAYFATLANDSSPAAQSVTLFYSSPNGGLEWAQPIVLSFIDREYLTIDRTSGRYRGRVYLHGNSFHNPTADNPDNSSNLFTLYRSDDNGAAFRIPVSVHSDFSHMSNGNAEVLSDGTYVVGFPDLENTTTEAGIHGPNLNWTFKVLRSQDGGESFEKADVIVRGCEGDNPLMIATDHTDGPFKDRIYAAWPCHERSGHMDIQFSYSADRGKTWSASRVINDEPDRDSPERTWDQSLPVVAVNKWGVVGIQWYDHSEVTHSMGWRTRFAASLDGGETFLPSVKVSEALALHAVGERLPLSVFAGGGGGGIPSNQGPIINTFVGPDRGVISGGDTVGMAGDANGAFHSLWVDNRTGILQIWTATITVNAKGLKNGAENLASLRDVTREIAVDYANINYDPKTGDISFDATLTNNSKDLVAVPIALRVIDLTAPTGSVEIINADNGQKGSGAVWDYSSSVPNGILRPGARTGVKRFKFRVSTSHPFTRGKGGGYPDRVIKFESKVLAKERDTP
jgi:hypothetical protein